MRVVIGLAVLVPDYTIGLIAMGVAITLLVIHRIKSKKDIST